MSLKLLLDENISPNVAVELQRLGFDAIHIRTIKMKGCKDSEVIAYAQREKRCLVTLDADFADIRYYPLGSHSGIIRLKIKFAPTGIILGVLRSLLPKLTNVQTEKGVLVVSDGKRFRIKLPQNKD